MNRTAFAARLTDAELTDEITMYEVEQVAHRNDPAWNGYNMLHALLNEQETRRAAATLSDVADFDAWLWALPVPGEQATTDTAAQADMQRYGWEDGRPVEYQTV